MHCVVTGGCGFIGSHISQSLRDAGYRVTVLDCSNEADMQVNICETGAVEEAIRLCKPDFVFHIAAIADARVALNTPVRAIEVNVAGTANVFEAARISKVRRVLLASTCWVAGAMRPGIIDETEPFQSTGAGHIYTTTKIASELIAHDFYALYKLPFTILRYGIPYGPNMWSGLVLRSFLDNLATGQSLSVFGDGSASRRFLFIRNLAEAHVLALQDVANNQVYNLEGMRSVSIKELAETVIRLVGEGRISYREDPLRVGEFQYFRKAISNAKALVDLGWEPRTDLESGVRQTIEWYHTQVAPLPGLEVSIY